MFLKIKKKRESKKIQKSVSPNRKKISPLFSSRQVFEALSLKILVW